MEKVKESFGISKPQKSMNTVFVVFWELNVRGRIQHAKRD